VSPARVALRVQPVLRAQQARQAQPVLEVQRVGVTAPRSTPAQTRRTLHNGGKGGARDASPASATRKRRSPPGSRAAFRFQSVRARRWARFGKVPETM